MFIVTEYAALSNIVLTSDEVESVLKSLPVGKAVGPDGISYRVLKELSMEISPALCGFFNQSLYTGIVPDSFKQAYVSPVHKGGDPSEISNYRPISLLSNLDKAFERLVFKYVYIHFLENNILTSFQSGFRRVDSTVTCNQLSYLYNTFCQALDAGKEVRAIFCDISKAFDRVWHAGLIHKLKSARISGNLLSWFTNYLTGRKQRVVMSGVQSAWNFYLSWGTSRLYTWSTSLPSLYKRYCSRHWIIYTAFCRWYKSIYHCRGSKCRSRTP